MSHAVGSVVLAVQAWLLVRALRQHFSPFIVSQDIRCFILLCSLMGAPSTFRFLSILGRKSVTKRVFCFIKKS